MKPQRQIVTSCVDCPFADDETPAIWHCHGAYTPEGWPRALPVNPPTPPTWCPLRKQPRLIVLS